MNDLRTPAVLLGSVLTCYLVSSMLAVLSLDLASDIVQFFTYCSLALLVSWVLLRYGNGSEDVIYAIDSIANFIFAMVSISVLRISRIINSSNVGERRCLSADYGFFAACQRKEGKVGTCDVLRLKIE